MTKPSNPKPNLRAVSETLLEDRSEFRELIRKHNVDPDLVTRLLRLVMERHYSSTASDTSLREDVEAELKKAERRTR